jgi:hypothetical protein
MRPNADEHNYSLTVRKVHKSELVIALSM